MLSWCYYELLLFWDETDLLCSWLVLRTGVFTPVLEIVWVAGWGMKFGGLYEGSLSYEPAYLLV